MRLWFCNQNHSLDFFLLFRSLLQYLCLKIFFSVLFYKIAKND